MMLMATVEGLDAKHPAQFYTFTENGKRFKKPWQKNILT